MNLRTPALLLISLTCLLAILGQWDSELARWWCLPAAFLLVGLAYEAASVRRRVVVLQLLAPEVWPLGRSQQMQYAFRQDSGWSLWIQAALTAPSEFAVEPKVETLLLTPGVQADASLAATARRLGSYQWPATLVRIRGPVHLAWWSRQLSTPCIAPVVPDLDTRFEQAMGSRRAGGQRSRFGGAGMEVLQMREYRPGDPLRIVDWKATARRGRLISRDTYEDQHLEIIVAVDASRASGLGAGETDRLSLYVNIAARFAQRAAELDDAVGLLVFASQPLAALPPARGEAAVARIYALLASCRVQPGESNPVLAATRIRTIAHRRSLVVLLTDLEDASAGNQLIEAVQLLTPKHFPFVAGFRSAGIAELSQARVNEPLGAYRALAAVEYGNTVAGNVRALRTLGAAALTALPEHLDKAVFEAYREFRERRRI